MKGLLVSKRNELTLIAIFVVFALGAFIASRTYAKASAQSDIRHSVALTMSGIQPSAIAITKGDYVEFDTKDGRTHEIGQGKGDDAVHQDAGQYVHDHLIGGKQSGNFGPGEGYKVQFSQTGTYDFHDHLHPELSLTVVVY